MYIEILITVNEKKIISNILFYALLFKKIIHFEFYQNKLP